jgi:L-threonylcarbamoyladenylate synthase
LRWLLYNMKSIKIDPEKPDSAAIKLAADAIRRGELVVFPTETVYGLAADALNDDAVRRVFEAKHREENQPLPVQIAGLDHLSRVSSDISKNAELLGKRFWPGPLTMVVKKSEAISDLVSGGLDTVGVRVPDHPVALALLRELGSPIVATSANLSGHKPPACADDAVEQLGDIVAVVLDAGESEIGVASTVVDVTVDPPKILRLGTISREQIFNVIGNR